MVIPHTTNSLPAPLLMTPVAGYGGPFGRALYPVEVPAGTDAQGLASFIHPEIGAGNLPQGSRFFVASGSAVKIDAVRAAVSRFAPDSDAAIEGMKAASNVAEQPVGYRETWLGALNRLADIEKRIVTEQNDFGISIENGLIPTMVNGSLVYVDVACVVIKRLIDQDRAFALSAGVVFPKDDIESARNSEGGFASHTVGSFIAKRLGGDPQDPQATLTGGAASRAEMLEGAILAALARLQSERPPMPPRPPATGIFAMPEHYEIDASAIRAAVNAKDILPESLVALFSADPFLDVQYDGDPGLVEGYTLREHTVMVLRQFEKYFAPLFPNPDDLAFMRAFLALHDIGKTLATTAGDNRLQHAFSEPLARVLFTQLGFSAAQVALAQALLRGDPVGKVVRGKISDAEAARQIAESARFCGMEPSRYLPILMAYYKADASAYSVDSDPNSIPSLDFLFDFSAKDGTLPFSARVQGRIDRLAEAVARL